LVAVQIELGIDPWRSCGWELEIAEDEAAQGRLSRELERRNFENRHLGDILRVELNSKV
jgi:hypothetical protein